MPLKQAFQLIAMCYSSPANYFFILIFFRQSLAFQEQIFECAKSLNQVSNATGLYGIKRWSICLINLE